MSTFLSAIELQNKILRPDSEAFRFCKRIDKSGTLRYKIRHLQDSIYVVRAFRKTSNIPDIVLNAINITYNEEIDFSKTHLFHRTSTLPI